METNIDQPLQLVLKLTRLATAFNRKLDGQLSVHGLGYTDFVILYYLLQSPANKLRRTDLAGLMGVTASGVTRILAPMEKIGLVTRDSSERDARISYVVITPAGKRLYKESLITAQHTAKNLLGNFKTKKLELLNDTFGELADNI